MKPSIYKKALRTLLPVSAVLLLLCLINIRMQAFSFGGNYGEKAIWINEVCPKNLTGLTDGEGNICAWIELYNASDEVISLDGYSLSDDPAWPDKWVFPADAVLESADSGANAFLLLFADETSGRDCANALHIGFLLGNKNETLTLYDPDGIAVDSLSWSDVDYDLTCGRSRNDGGSSGIFAYATPGRDNPLDYLKSEIPSADLGNVLYSLKSGFYEDTIHLELTSADPDAIILYTTDGSIPTIDSKIYTVPLTITSRKGEPNRYSCLPTALQIDWNITEDGNYQSSLANYALNYAPAEVEKCTTITARLYKDGHLGETITAQTYWIGLEGHSLPVLSLTAAPDDVFDLRDGIYMPGSTYFTLHKFGKNDLSGNFSSDKNVDGTVRLIGTDNQLVTQDVVEFHVSGGFSRYMPLKNLHIDLPEANGSYMPSVVNAEQLFSFTLRGTGSGSGNFALHQDAFLSNYLYDHDLGTQYNVPVALYFEDEYWGTYTLRESKNRNFYLRHYDISPGSLISLEFDYGASFAEEKHDLGEQLEAFDPNLPECMEWLEKNIDIDEYIRYMIAQMYIYNSDGIYTEYTNNVIIWKSAVIDPDNKYADGKWRFILNDLDMTLRDAQQDPFQFLLNISYSELGEEGIDWESEEWGWYYYITQILFQKLWQNQDFRNTFAEIYRAEMATTYAAENLLPAFDAWCDLLRPELAHDLARQQVAETLLRPLSEFLTNAPIYGQNMSCAAWEGSVLYIQQYFTERADIMLKYLDQYLAEAEEVSTGNGGAVGKAS